jgi:hypothetical protein
MVSKATEPTTRRDMAYPFVGVRGEVVEFEVVKFEVVKF